MAIRLNIDGQSVGFDFHFKGQNYVPMGVIRMLEDNIPFILHDGDRNGPIFIPSKLACIHGGQVLIHSGITDFQFSLSFHAGLYSRVDSLEQKEIEYSESKLLPYVGETKQQ